MRTLNLVFEDKEYDKLLRAKADTTWHDFILKLVEVKE
jgi:hypothetical protein